MLVLTETREKKSTGLSLSKITTFDYSSNSISYFIHYLEVTTFHESLHSIDSWLSQLYEIYIFLIDDQDAGHNFRENFSMNQL
jgi:hypothetical protein